MFIAPQLPERLPHSVVPLANLVSRPPFSRRGAHLARVRAPDRRNSSIGPCAFRLGTPALDLFPLRIWSQITRECLRALKPSQLDYSQLAGLRHLREAIAEHVQLRGTRCDADQVQIVMGAQRGLDLIAHMLLDPDDSARIEDPGYTGARGALASAGANVVSVPSTPKG
jgi:GntR family transcriptional regulator/MocR family aminotransferase